MKSTRSVALVLATIAICGISLPAVGRDTVLNLPIEDAAKANQAGTRLDGTVKFFWGDQSHPAPEKTLGTYTTNKKTNFFNKSDKEGCEWAWLSAMLTLQERAKKEGGNAVIDVHSVYRNNDFSSQTEYECGAGSVVGGVALRGTVVKLP
ncbi:MAG: excinuclease ATPase subunit [Hydrocarboniphaga sp.]|uniref:hypothetical protein n=1 Tax=Hydrocarboniphaga sp. TaxID=2033016 RepID=UPI00260476E7|nr:hypothetical protein [Hydrocarboniphaga sp.]MDB5969870.1 excinuclease ATPase subunit [Hydrocarboniphaga sp.]